MYKFNNENIITGYIKQLLHSINLPTCKVFNSIDKMVEYFDSYEGVAIVKKYKDNSDYLVYIKNKEIVNAIPYAFNRYYKNITKTLSLHNNIYDTKTHEYLGDYLRFLRDYKNINLMSLYNCYSANFLTDNKYKYILIPAKYNTIYSLAIDGKNISYYFGFDTDLKQIKNHFESNRNIINIKNCSFNNPVAIESLIDNIFKESLYKLIIRIPLINTNSICVLEGIESKNTDEILNNNKYIKIQANFDKNDLNINYNNVNIDRLASNFELLSSKANNNYSYPFADKLIEYLTNMTIIPGDIISKNIIDAKYKALIRYGNNNNNANIPSKLGKLNDSFNNIDRLRFIDAYQQKYIKDINKYDILGYIDKYIESALDDKSR